MQQYLTRAFVVIVALFIIYVAVSSALAQPTMTMSVTHDPPSQFASIGDTLTVKVIYHPTPADTVAFARMSMLYDSLIVRCIAIENGADAPAYSMAPFINWGPVTFMGANHVYLGQWFCVGCDEIPWSGHAITYTFVAVGPGTTTLTYREFGVRANYIDMQPWICYPGYVAEYTSDHNSLQECINALYLPTTTTITIDDTPSDVLAVEYIPWSGVKELYR